MRVHAGVAVVVWLGVACGGPPRPSAPVPHRIQLDGPGAFGLRDGDRVAVIVDGRRLGTATYDGSQLVRAEGAAVTWLRDADSAAIARVEVMKGPSAGREYGLRDSEVGAVLITTRRPPDDTSQADQRD